MPHENIPAKLHATESAWRNAAAACNDQLSASAVVVLSGEGGGWVSSDVQVATGQTVTLLATGEIWLSREANLAFPPSIALWYRIGDGPIARCVSNTGSFVADRPGTLSFLAKPPGEWADAAGNFLPDYPHAGASGGLLVAALVWSGNPVGGLQAFAARDSSRIAEAERARRANEKPLPNGWQPLWRVGDTRMFREDVEDGRAHIACRCDNDAAILKYPVDVPLTIDTRLAWSWRIERLPSEHPEDTLPHHDYLSIAVEFENGQDLTYFWSAGLPVGSSFRCPISWWDKHETHIVQRSGPQGLGQWMSEQQPILSDYQKAVGGEIPRRIVGVWLIALSAFQRRIGQASYRDLQLKYRDGAVWIGP
jgi:hypothetical protein